MSMSAETRARLMAMAQRDDNTQPSSEPYGDVAYADPGYQKDGKKRYPIDNAEHVRAAWNYVSHPNNAAFYTASQLSEIKSRILGAAKRFGVNIAVSDGQPNTPRSRRDDAEWRASA